MKYSEAIRLGGMMRPKAQGTIYDPETDGVCIQGAALDACGKLKLIRHRRDETIETLFPELFGFSVANLEPDDIEFLAVNNRPYTSSWYTIYGMSVWINDNTNWTRERIADWVEKMEIKYNIYNDQPITTEVHNEDTIDVLTPVN